MKKAKGNKGEWIDARRVLLSFDGNKIRIDRILGEGALVITLKRTGEILESLEGDDASALEAFLGLGVQIHGA